jgi:hypothetical protein
MLVKLKNRQRSATSGIIPCDTPVSFVLGPRASDGSDLFPLEPDKGLTPEQVLAAHDMPVVRLGMIALWHVPEPVSLITALPTKKTAPKASLE